MSELNEAEQAALEIGERISASEDQQVADTYEKAQEQEQQELTFAGKFRTAQDLEKAYLELQKKLGAPKDEEEASENPEDYEVQEEETEAVEEPTEPSEEEPTGFTQEQVDAIYDFAGGPEVYQAALDWAVDALSQEDQDEFNAALDTTNASAAKFAVKALVDLYKSQADFQGKQIRGRQSGNDGVKPFRSMAQMAEAMSDPRYERDPAYRQDVVARAAITDDDIY